MHSMRGAETLAAAGFREHVDVLLCARALEAFCAVVATAGRETG
jgi:hypothetical protein